MTKVKLHAPVAEMHGEFEKNSGIIMRQKKYRAHVAELRLRLENYRTRFYAQFKKPDPEAPFEKKLRPGASKLYRKQYSKLDTFIQAILRHKLQ